MTAPAIAAPVSVPARPRSRTTKGVIAGRVLSGIAIAFLAVDAIFKIFPVKAVIEGSAQLGYPAETIVPIGITLMACVVLYAIPATSVFGAVLLTGYLGGAIATHVRVVDPLFSHTLFPTYVAALIWGGLYLRNARLRALVGR
jgi:hypothetical protein